MVRGNAAGRRANVLRRIDDKLALRTLPISVAAPLNWELGQLLNHCPCQVTGYLSVSPHAGGQGAAAALQAVLLSFLMHLRKTAHLFKHVAGVADPHGSFRNQHIRFFHLPEPPPGFLKDWVCIHPFRLLENGEEGVQKRIVRLRKEIFRLPGEPVDVLRLPLSGAPACNLHDAVGLQIRELCSDGISRKPQVVGQFSNRAVLRPKQLNDLATGSTKEGLQKRGLVH